ncbi:putative prophage phiRv2 integrase [compost metagenome]
MPSYEHRGKNSYRLTVETEAGINKERGRERKTVKLPEGLTPKKQKEWLEAEWYQFKTEVESGAFITPEKMILSVFVVEWKNKYSKGRYAPKTESLHDYLLTLILPYIGHLKLCDIKTLHIIQYFSDIQDLEKRKGGKKKPYSQTTLISLHKLLKGIFDLAVTWNVIKVSPMAGLKYPKLKKKKADCYNEEEAKTLFQSLESEPLVFKTIVILATTTGLREGEISGLERKHINLKTGVIQVEQQMIYTKQNGLQITDTKTDDGNRKVSIPKLVVDLLKEVFKQSSIDRAKLGSLWKGWKDNDRQFVFNTSTGAPYGPAYISGRWINFRKKAGLREIKFHELRHTSASLLINKGVHAKVISERLGHSDIKITMNTYGHVFQKADHAAAEMFDDIFQTK